MSSALVRPILVAVFVAATILCSYFAIASAAGVEDMLAGQLIPSAAPSLLGPITSAGRKGWDCKPEHVAAAPHWRSGELPPGPDSL